MIGAAIIPATAPMAAANPQPKANIRPTRMPTSRLDTGFRAAARIANPRAVKRKKKNTRIKTAMETLSLRMMVRRIRKISCTDERGETERWLVEHQELRPQHGVAHTGPAAVISILRRSERFSTFTSSAEAIHTVPSFDIGPENRLPSSIYKGTGANAFQEFCS
jgi:hypothetical protein